MAAGTARLAVARARKLARAARRPELHFALRNRVLPTMEHLDVPIPPVANVIDVGASRGQFSAHARSRWSGARIVCFEPVPAALATLRRLADRYRLEVHAFALDEEAGKGELFVAADDDSSSLLEPTLRQVGEFRGARIAATVEVERRRLDDFDLRFERPCLLKIDVQGAELAVLRGGKATLESVDLALVECSYVELYNEQPLAPDVTAFMAGHGFRLAGAYNATAAADGTQLQADLLFERA